MCAQAFTPVVRTLVLALLLVAPLLAASSAHAQAPVVDALLGLAVEDPGRAFEPGSNASVTVLVNYAVRPGAQPAPDPSQERYNYTSPTRVVLAIKQLPSWGMNATIEPAELLIEVPPQAGVGGNYARRATVTFVVASDAPALQREEIVVEGVAAANGNIKEARGESAPVKLRAAVVGLLNVTAEPFVVVPGGRWTTVPFTVRNDGNYALPVQLNVTTRPENSQVEFPREIRLEPGASEVVEVRVRTPWTNAEVGELQLEAVPLLEDEDGRPSSMVVDVTGTSAVPGPSTPVLLAALVAACLVARRRRAA